MVVWGGSKSTSLLMYNSVPPNIICSSAGGSVMVHEMIDGTYRQTNLPNESAEYLAKREELRQAEIELMRQRERVAELRRALPPGATVQDYEFLEGPASLDDGDEPVRR